ncbi:beta-CASP ribonuclease aCPSF1 [Candidatus Bathyarchaeota archaeon]|nr:MAG: beta-CASP ribonuclease aCPSF1 [Candidatus Bathyarchaeota archaeon]TMI52394.1 MAG: beta-CASP ribonuclease aCPSF1 [Candidatus Bathyarchaeota archaeon]
MPKDAEITRIEFEGPRLAIYVKNVGLLAEQSYVVTEIVNLLHKRIVIRSDQSIRLPEREAEAYIRKIIPAEAEISSINFDPSLGEVVVEATKPGVAIGKEAAVLQQVVKETRWRPRILRAPPLHSKIISSTRHILHTESEERSRILRDVGERIFRPTFSKAGYVRLVTLGAFHEVGRAAMLIQAGSSSILLDSGINPGAQDPASAYPRFDTDEFDLEKLDAVVISHAHLDHCGILPFLYKYGYDGPVYCSEPTQTLMTLHQLDYLDVHSREGEHSPYDQKDVREVVTHTIPLRYNVVTDVAPDIKLTFHNAGHILGSSMVHLHIGEGLHNIVYSADFKFGRTMMLDPATALFPRAETLIIESTYGGPDDIMPDREGVEGKLVSIVNDTVEKGGKVLIPVPAVGRAQEIMLVLDAYMKNGALRELPIYIEGMVNEATAIHTAFPEYLVRDIKEQILHKDINPFQSEYFHPVTHPSDREEIIAGGPCVIIATSGMLEGGPAIDYFRHLAPDPRNTLAYVSYQVDGTLGNRIKNGLKEVSLYAHDGKMEMVKVNMRVESIEGFSGHSDRNQLLGFIKRMAPKPTKIIVNHGERRKSDLFAQNVNRIFGIKTVVPDVLESIRLR